jgi:hypothetical protein
LLSAVGVNLPRPVVEQSWQMTDITRQFGMSPITAGWLCSSLKIPDHGHHTFTTPTHGK